MPWLEEIIFIDGNVFENNMRINFMPSDYRTTENVERVSGNRVVIDQAAKEYGPLFALDKQLQLYLPTHFTALQDTLRQQQL